MGRRGALLIACCMLAISVPAPVGAAEGDDAALAAWVVVPPGNGGVSGITTGHRDDQRIRYETLDDAVADGTFTDESLGEHYLPARLGLPDTDSVTSETPRPGVVVRWDGFGVPHVKGETAADVAFGAGWVMAEGRGPIAEIARTIGRRGTAELGDGDFFSAIGATERVDYSDAELQAQLDLLVQKDPVTGPRVLEELQAYVDGFNAWVAANPSHRVLPFLLGLERGPWRPVDVVAANLTVVTTNNTGGAEADNARILRRLQSALGPDLAAAWFADLRAADAATTTTSADPVPYPVFAPGHTGTDPASIALVDGPATARVPRPLHSNVVVVDAAHSASGHPIMVGGPQNPLTSPSLLMDVELEGGGYRARGALFPGLGPYVIVGRSTDYAWTSTSGETDQIDVRAERLCEPDGSAPDGDSTHYLFAGACIPFERPSPTGVPRSAHGPVVERATADGVPVALTLQRASRGSEVLAALAIRRLNRGEVDGPEEFLDAVGNITFSGHWFYADAQHIAYQLAGLHPVRAAGAATDLPTWGSGEWEWQGTVDPAVQPHAIDPAQGWLASWNNRAAPGWQAADDDWGNVGPHRVDLLGRRVDGRSRLTPADVVAAHTEAGSSDLRGELVWPEISALLGDAPAPNARLARVRDLIDDWSARGAPRRDRDLDWWLDDPAVPFMDAFFVPALRLVFDPALAGLTAELAPRLDAGPKSSGSSFGYGWYGILARDLARVRNGSGEGAQAPPACGGGDLDRCRAVLWHALDVAHSSVRARQPFWFGTDPARWRQPALPTRIFFPPYLTNPRSMRWSNRPAYEVVFSFAGDRRS